MNIYDLISRAQKLRKETQLDSVSPDRVGGLHEDTLKYINEFQLLASSPSLHKIYASVSAMQSDKSPKSDLTGKPLKPGQLVVIVPANQTDATAGDVYRYDGPSGNTSAWTFVAKIGAVPADAELSATSTNPPQNKVVTEKLTELESEFSISHARSTTNTNYNLLPISCKKGDILKVSVEIANYQGTRIFITYNGENTKRLIDTASNADFINGVVEVVCPADISVLGVYCGTSVTYTLKVIQLGYVYDNIYKLNQKASETDTKITELSSETNIGVKNILQDPQSWINGYVQSGNGTPALQYVSDPNRKMVVIPVIEEEILYYFYKGNRADLNAFLDANKERIAYNFSVKDGLNELVVPSGASYVALTIQVGETDTYAEKWLIREDSIAGKLQSQILQSGGVVADDLVKFIVSGNYLLFESDNFGITASLDKAPNKYYGGNKVFNFINVRHIPSDESIAITDDIAPCHVLNTTIGANHGQPCSIVTITGHGLTNADVGSAWIQDGITYYIIRIVDTDNVAVLSANQGTSESPSFITISQGTLTKGSKSLTITNVTGSQLWPSATNITHKILVDGVEVAANKNGTYYGKEVGIVEKYDVLDPVSVLNNLIAKAGNVDEPIYNGDVFLSYENIYRFTKGCNVVVIANIIPRKTIAFRDYHFAQSALGQSFKYYIPNSLPIKGYDFRKPLKVTWSNAMPYIVVREDVMADVNKPVNRVVTYGDNFGFALGFLPYGVGKNLLQYTSATFELRNNTGKIYPFGVNSQKVGETLMANQVYSAVMLRSLIDYSTINGARMSFYTIPFNKETFVYIDYSDTMSDKVVLNDSYNGKKIEVIESTNANLMTDVYNGGFYINANYVEGETCYIVLKIVA